MDNLEEKLEKIIEKKLREKEKDIREEIRQEVQEEEKKKQAEQNKPLPHPSKRNIHYKFDSERNPYWKGQDDVWLKETVAISFHDEFMRRGAEYAGDQNGNMSPPRDFRAAWYNAAGDIIKNKSKNSNKF